MGDIKETDFVAVDNRAREEEKTFSAKSKIGRQKERGLHIAFLILVWVAVALFIIILIVKVCHLALPDKYCWLDETHTKKLDEFLTSGFIGGAVASFFKGKLLAPSDNNTPK